MSARWKSSDLKVSANGRLVAKTHETNPTPLLKRKFEGIVVGIDPSLRGTGLAVLRCTAGKPTLIFSSTLKTKGTPTQALAQIAQSLDAVCRQYQPTAAAIEDTIYVQNNRTAITLGSVRGAVLAALALHQVPCEGFAPARIKQAVVGYGRASKQQMMAMTRTLLNLQAPLPSDEADAAGAALCWVYNH